MPGQRPSEPIAPATIPGKRTDPKIPPDDEPANEDVDNGESESERRARESEKAFDEAIVRMPPG